MAQLISINTAYLNHCEGKIHNQRKINTTRKYQPSLRNKPNIPSANERYITSPYSANLSMNVKYLRSVLGIED
jgi:hypothetical protein